MSFSWGANSFNVKTIGRQRILLPTRNDEIDFDFMEIFISAIQKLVIRDVALYAEQEIDATLNVIGKE